MKCRKCGEEILEDSMFCNKCGTKILVEKIGKVEEIKEVNNDAAIITDQTHDEVNEKVSLETKVVGKKKFFTPVKVIICTIAVVIVIVVFSAYAITTNNKYTQKMKQADALVTSGKYNDALKVYGEALKIKSTSEVKPKIDKTLILKKSADTFNIGMNYFNTTNYESAIASFKSVIKEDSKNYKIAVDKIKQCIKISDDSAIKQAQESASKNDYDTAIQCVNDALNIDGSNQQLLDLRTKYTKDKADADAKAQAKADAKAKAEAEVKDKNRTASINQMKLKLSNNDFDGAKSTLSSVLFSDDEIKTIKVYIDGKQEYLYEIQDDANHPDYKAPNSKYNYIGVQVKLADINPQYQGIYSNEIKDYVHKFMNDDEWKKEYSDAVESSTKIQNQMNAPEPSIGMTAEQVRASRWGNPNEVNKTITANGTSEQWVYDVYGYVYLDNGIVTTIQTH